MLHLPTRSVGSRGLQRRVGPERLTEPEDVGVDARALAVRDPAPIAGQVGGLVQESPATPSSSAQSGTPPGDRGSPGRAAVPRARRFPAASDRRSAPCRSGSGAMPVLYQKRLSLSPATQACSCSDWKASSPARTHCAQTGSGIVLVEVAAQAIQRDRRPLPVPGTDAAPAAG